MALEYSAQSAGGTGWKQVELCLEKHANGHVTVVSLLSLSRTFIPPTVLRHRFPEPAECYHLHYITDTSAPSLESSICVSRSRSARRILMKSSREFMAG